MEKPEISSGEPTLDDTQPLDALDLLDSKRRSKFRDSVVGNMPLLHRYAELLTMCGCGACPVCFVTGVVGAVGVAVPVVQSAREPRRRAQEQATD